MIATISPGNSVMELERDHRARSFWDTGLISRQEGFEDYAGYLATIPEPPEINGLSSELRLVLVDPRVDLERMCREGTAGFSASSLKDCHHEDIREPNDRPYWILVELVENPDGQLIRETIRKQEGLRRGCILMEGLAFRVQLKAEVKPLPLVLYASRFYGPPADRHFCAALNPNKQFVPICTDARISAFVAVVGRRVCT